MVEVEVSVFKMADGFCIYWADTNGYGKIDFTLDTNTMKWTLETETMGKEFVKKCLERFVDDCRMVK